MNGTLDPHIQWTPALVSLMDRFTLLQREAYQALSFQNPLQHHQEDLYSFILLLRRIAGLREFK